MATQKGMSGIDFTAMLFELKSCLPLWIGKIYQYNIDTFGFRLNGEERQKYNFIAECARRAHISEALMDAPKNPSGYSMFLRKYIQGGRVLDISQYGIQRIIDFTIGKSEKQYHLIFEFFDDGNAILCDEDYIIINPLKNHTFKDRKVLPHVKYEFIGAALDEITPKYIRDMLENSDKDLVRTLAGDLLLGGDYAEELCAIAGMDKNASARDIARVGVGDGSEESEVSEVSGRVSDATQKIHAALLEILSRAQEGRKPVIAKNKGCCPFLFAGDSAVTEFDSYNKALEAYYPLPKTTEKASAKPKLSKAEVIRLRQQNAIKGFDRKIAENKSKVDTIYANYGQVSGVISTLDAASKQRSWQDIEKILKGSDMPIAKTIKKIYPDTASVDLLIDNTVLRLYIRETVEQNADRYYSEIKKYKKKKTGAEKAMERFVVPTEKPDKKESKKEGFSLLKPKWYHKYRWFYTSDGVLVIGGRDAGTNEEIVKKYLQGSDTFVHADVHGGSVVIVKGETQCWDEVAQFALSYSNVWKNGHFTGDVYAAERSQVSKTAESGEFVARGAFVIRGERRYFRDVAAGLAIGLQYEPAVAVIGGPITAVKARARYCVTLKPGQYEPNDAAKKVLKALKSMVPEEEQKSLKNVLNTETVAAFVPPGGSDIIE
ncbi:MAG: NFACT family protein [Methanomicrobium sp.]|nr:NFACT family protein [Methanomicrobium sp.]